MSGAEASGSDGIGPWGKPRISREEVFFDIKTRDLAFKLARQLGMDFSRYVIEAVREKNARCLGRIDSWDKKRK